MELRRPLLVAAGAVLALLAAVPQTMSAASAAPTAIQAASVVPFQGTQGTAALQRIARPGRTVTLPTTHTYKGQRRVVVVHVPDGLLAPAPLVVALHAHSQEPKAIRAYSRLEQLADDQGFVVAFPQGAAGSWNAGTCCVPASKDRIDDVAFLDEVLGLVRTQALIDTNRISLTGGSNGAMMALRYACERPDVVASVAVVSGPLIAKCPLDQPVPVLVLHGARDTVVPLRGGRNGFLGVTFPPVDRSLEPFRRAKGEVRLQVVPRAGHDWMTRDKHGVDATLAAWLWMRDHPRV